ncbi:Inositol-pentakisphosphate 2-kinase [Mortierella sp. AM989]|nr:Inositol-pentakisphosphate 2-kinase [Mortierella sp. AM989]
MATLNELYCVEHWKYRAEGNANLVLQYIGPDPRFKTTLLRLRKNSTKVVGPVNKNDISGESSFISKVISRLVGQEFVEQLIPVVLPSDFLKTLAVAIDPFRPKNRLHKRIDCSQAVGFLALDHARFIKPSANHPTISVEIKPKWGFLTASAFIRKEQIIKRRKCRFCMHQHRKLKNGEEESLSEYCPIDLFSGNDFLVEDSINALIKTPQNNLRLFVDGTQRTISKDEVSRCFCGSSDVATPGDLSSLNDDEEQCQSVSLTDVLAKILNQSPLLRRLSRLQLALDSLDVETIHQFYVQLADPITGALPNPTVEEYLKVADNFLYRTDMDDMMAKDQEAFLSNNVAGLGFEPSDLEDEGAVPRSLKLHFIHEFLLSTTLKDCSIMVTMRQEDNKEEDNEVEDQSVPRDTTARVERSSLEFHENYHRIKVNGKAFIYKVICIDLDPKKINNIPKYLKKDRDIVNHYLSTVGDREPSCGSQ